MIFLEEKEAHARPLLKEISSLNIYQINISQILVYAKLRNAIPWVFLSASEEISISIQLVSQNLIVNKL